MVLPPSSEPESGFGVGLLALKISSVVAPGSVAFWVWGSWGSGLEC